MCGQVCGDKVWRRAEEEKAEEPGIQNQKQEPHTKMWGKNINKKNAYLKNIYIPKIFQK